MPLDHEVVEKVKFPDDPERCQGMTPSGQCMNKQVKGSQYCLAHGGASTLKSQQRESIYRFRVEKYQQRVGEISRSPIIKSLREEIGVLRMLLEEKLNNCKNDNELILASGEISELVTKIDKLVNSCNSIELKLGILIDKQTLMGIVDQIVNVLSDQITDTTLLDKIASQILLIIESTELKTTND